MRLSPDSERAGRLEQSLLLAALLFYAVGQPLVTAVFRPGFSAYDEESTLDQIQAWREGAPLDLRFARSSVHRLLTAGLVGAGGPHLFWTHLPAFVAVLAEALLLFVWLRGKLGERAALWAALADLVCGATFARGTSLLGSGLLPCLFLLHALALEAVKRPWQALAWGASAGLFLLDYEGWAGALAFLVPYALWTWRAKPWLRPAAALGGAAALVLVLALTPDFARLLGTRHDISAQDAGYVARAWANLKGLLGAGDRMAFSAPAWHAWPPPWIWALVLVGIRPALRSWGWAYWLLATGSLALGLAGTSEEPHRLSLALLALAALAGAGVACLWASRLGRALCLSLLLLGAADEIHAWVQEPPAKMDLVYGGSLNLEAAAGWLAGNQPRGGWDVISGLGPADDGAFRFLLDQDGVRPGGAIPVALVAWDYRPGLVGLPTLGRALSFGTWHPVLLFFAAPPAASRLRAVSAALKPLRRARLTLPPSEFGQAAARWLQDPSNTDPWARTVAWEIWLFGSLQSRNVDPGGMQQMMQEPLVCGWAPDVLAKELDSRNPALAAAYRRKAEQVDPARRGLDAEARIARY